MFEKIKRFFYKIRYRKHKPIAIAHFCNGSFFAAIIKCRKCGIFCNYLFKTTSYEQRDKLRRQIRNNFNGGVFKWIEI